MGDYFQAYSSREFYIICEWVRRTKWLRDKVVRCERHNTPFHDALLTLLYGKEEIKIFIQVKEEEWYWYSRTGNVGLDYISAFKYKNEEIKRFVREHNNWIKPEDLEYFIENIEVHKWGKLITCDAHIHIFYVENDTGEVVLCNAYDNAKLKHMLPEINKQHRLRINDKPAYGLKDDWESAAYFVKPAVIESCLIKTFEDLMDAWKACS